jgi:hypothetical protein
MTVCFTDVPEVGTTAWTSRNAQVETTYTSVEGYSAGRPNFVSKGLLARIERLRARTASARWDHLRARAIPASVWHDVAALCSCVAAAAPRIDEPFVSPCADGSVHVTWSARDRSELVVEVREESNFDFTDGEGVGTFGRDEAAARIVEKLT